MYLAEDLNCLTECARLRTMTGLLSLIRRFAKLSGDFFHEGWMILFVLQNPPPLLAQNSNVLLYFLSNGCHWDIMLIPICTSGKYVDILGTYTLNRGSGMVGPINLV